MSASASASIYTFLSFVSRLPFILGRAGQIPVYRSNRLYQGLDEKSSVRMVSRRAPACACGENVDTTSLRLNFAKRRTWEGPTTVQPLRSSPPNGRTCSKTNNSMRQKDRTGQEHRTTVNLLQCQSRMEEGGDVVSPRGPSCHKQGTLPSSYPLGRS